MADLTNPFDLLGETDENAEPNIEQLAAAKAAQVKSAAKKEEEKAATKAPVVKADAGRGTRGGRGADVRGRGAPGRGRIGTRADSGEVAENGYDAGAPAARGRGGRGEGRGRGGRGRGAGRGTYDSSRPRREFDRHDGTGRGYEATKRGGGGRGNWGAEDGSADAPAEEAPVVEEAEKVVVEGEEAAETPAEEVAPVEEVKEMTLEEYEAILAEKKAELNKARQARTIDMSEFANLKALNKDEEEEENPLEVSTSKEKKGPRAKERKEVVTLETGFKVGEAPSFGGRGGRGGRGRGGDRGDRGDRGARFGGRGGDRGDRPFAGRGGRGAAINVEDTSAFPSLA